MSSKVQLTLIENPKSYKDRENNKAYYQEKFFSKGQKRALNEKNRKEEVARKIIGERQKFGEFGQLYFNSSGGNCEKTKKENWKYTSDGIKLFQDSLKSQSPSDEPPHDNSFGLEDNVVPPEIPTPMPVIQVTLTPLVSQEVDSWEELVDEM
jgi:hypothetical protein